MSDDGGEISAVAYSPNGRFILSGMKHVYDDKHSILRLWDVTTGNSLREFIGHIVTVNSVSFSTDSCFALSGSDDKTLRLWDVGSGKCLRLFNSDMLGDIFWKDRSHSDNVTAVAFSPDNRLVISGSRDKTVKIWSLSTGVCFHTLLGHANGIESIAVSPNGHFVLSASYKEIRLWDITTGQCLRTFWGHTDNVNYVVFSPDGCLALSGSCDKTLRLWDVKEGQCVCVFEGNTSSVLSVAFSLDGRFAISGCFDKTIRLWDITTGQCLRSFNGHVAPVSSITFSPDGHFALSGSYDKTLRLWDASSVMNRSYVSPWLYSMAISVENALELQHSHAAYLSQARAAFASEKIAEALTFLQKARSVPAFGKSPECLDLQARIGARSRIKSYGGGWLKRNITGHTHRIRSVAFSPNGHIAISGSVDKTLRLWDIITGQCLHIFTGHTNSVNTVAFSPDARFVISGSADKTIRIWDVASGKCLHVFDGYTERTEAEKDYSLKKNLHCESVFRGRACGINSVTFSSDGRLVLAGDGANAPRLLDVTTGQCILRFKGHTEAAGSVVFSPDGRFAISGSDDHSIRIWNVLNGKCMRTFKAEWVNSVTISLDGRFILSGCGSLDNKNSTLRMWDVATGQNIFSLTGHSAGIKSVAFSPDSQFITSGSDDRTIRLWDICNRKNLLVFEGHTAGVTSVVFSPDGRFILSGSDDNTIKLWELDWEYEYDPEHDPVLRCCGK